MLRHTYNKKAGQWDLAISGQGPTLTKISLEDKHCQARKEDSFRKWQVVLQK